MFAAFQAEMLDWAFDDLEREGPSPVSAGVIVFAGSWNLRSCRIEGRFALHCAVALLPTTLVSLYLWPTSTPERICLSSFQRFDKLQTLRLGVGLVCRIGVGVSDLTFEKESNTTLFKLDACAASLEQLEVFDSVYTTMLDAYDMDTCLPNINLLSLRLIPNHSGWQLARKVIACRWSHKLKLGMYSEDDDMLYNDTTRSRLVVPADSRLEQLLLTAPSCMPDVPLEITKPDVDYVCNQSQTTGESSAYMARGIQVTFDKHCVQVSYQENILCGAAIGESGALVEISKV